MAFNHSAGTDAHGSHFYDILGNQTNHTYINASATPPASGTVTTYREQGKSDSEVYARILLPKKHGYPLWLPDPFSNLPSEYKEEGVSVGDVGIITSDGAFDFLFNICLPSDHPVNSGRVPPGFVPLELDRHRDVATMPDMHPPGCDIASTSIRMENIKSDIDLKGKGSDSAGIGGGFRFTCSSNEGALLVLPDGASRFNLLPLSKFLAYGILQAERWYHFVNGQLCRMASNGSLYLVTGVDKASCWGVASFSNSSGETGISLKFTAAHNAGVPATRHYAWERSGRVAARSGPRRQVGPENQCVFIRGYKLALRGGLLSAALKGPVKVSHIVDTSPSDVLAKGDSIPGAPKSSFFGSRFGGDSKGSCSEGPKDSVDAESINVGVVAELFPGMSEPYHPSTIINQYLLHTNPDANLAMTHDDVWCTVIDEADEYVPDGPELLRRIFEKHHVLQKDGCVFLATSSEVNADPSLTTGKVAKSQDVTTSVLPPIRTRTPPNASSDVMAFPGVLGFPTIARTVTDICQAVGQVKVFRQQCKDLGERCVALLLAWADSSMDVETINMTEFADVLEATISPIHRRVKDWASLGRLNSVLRSRQIKEGIDDCHRDIDGCMTRLNISKMQGIRDFAAIRERDREEFREMLLTLSTTQKTLRASSATEEIMQFLQTELEDPGLGSQEVQRLRQALLALEEDTSTVKPHADSTRSYVGDEERPSEALRQQSPKRLIGTVAPHRHTSEDDSSITEQTLVSTSVSSPRSFVKPVNVGDEERVGPSEALRQQSPKRLTGTVVPRRYTSEDDSSITEQTLVSTSVSSPRSFAKPVNSSWSTPSTVADFMPTVADFTPTVADFTPTVADFTPTVVDFTPYCIRRPDGSIRAGTLGGLVEQLTIDTDVRKDAEYRDIFLSTHTAFSSSEDVLTILIRRFHDIALSPIHAEHRARIRYNVIAVMRDWVLNPHVKAGNNVLAQMKEFASSVHSSPALLQLAGRLLQGIDLRIYPSTNSFLSLPTPPSQEPPKSPTKRPSFEKPPTWLTSWKKSSSSEKRSVLSKKQPFSSHKRPFPLERRPSAESLSISEHLSRRSSRSGDVSPQNLALALTILEGEQYNSILSADYIDYLQRPSGPNNVDAACATNGSIIQWVKMSVLEPSSPKGRADVFKLFVNTAHECRKLRNFSSMAAIISALQSDAVQRLTKTKKEVPDRLMAGLEKLVRPDNNFQSYQAALKESAAPCVPWLAVHLVGLTTVARNHQNLININGRLLINFTKWVKLNARMKEIFEYKSPNYVNGRELKSFAYLEGELWRVNANTDLNESLEARSNLLEAEERGTHKFRRPF